MDQDQQQKPLLHKCECGYVFHRVVRVWPFTCCCGKRYQQDEIAVLTKLSWIVERRNICQKCEHYNPLMDTCGVLVAIGKPGVLGHSKGISNPKARCPDINNRRWVEHKENEQLQMGCSCNNSP